MLPGKRRVEQGGSVGLKLIQMICWLPCLLLLVPGTLEAGAGAFCNPD